MGSRGTEERLSWGRIHRIAVIAVSSVRESLIQKLRVNHEPQAVAVCFHTPGFVQWPPWEEARPFQT